MEAEKIQNPSLISQPIVSKNLNSNSNSNSNELSNPNNGNEIIIYVKEFIKIDNEITEKKKEIKEQTKRKKELTEILVGIMKENEIDCFDIKGGALQYKKNKVTKPLSTKYLTSTLETFFEKDLSMAETLARHLLENREEEIKETIQRKVKKQKN